jgi:predicted RNA-binding protein associated with RNAse of E/G family
MERTPLPAPVRVGDRVILDVDAPVLWFTFDHAWHDIGRFHTAAGAFTGYYANILTPVRFRSPLEWDTTDLFLDVWLDADGTAALLDEDELEDALDRGWITPDTAARARTEARRLLHGAESGAWPPVVVNEWPLARARSVLECGTRDEGAV